ncbi:hypothetical protein [Sphingobium yanoikuyae]|jgi:hypothetical protein|uniref:hypothetical protein n=1 Tax=Sphingobium yanoikuyae TaxID=13690 RepID=UPI000262C03C|nr:hypothetical protein [Sphingobium yanoikuyae]
MLNHGTRGAHRRPSSKLIPPLPPEFAQQFVEGGWRRIERVYGARNDLVRKWIAMAGGERELKRLRREYMAGRRKG